MIDPHQVNVGWWPQGTLLLVFIEYFAFRSEAFADLRLYMVILSAVLWWTS